MDEKGKWSGLGRRFLPSYRVRSLQRSAKVEFVPLSTADRFEALKSGKIDVLSRNSTWAMGRELDFGVVFTGVTYYDGQGFLCPQSTKQNLSAGARRSQDLRTSRNHQRSQFGPTSLLRTE